MPAVENNPLRTLSRKTGKRWPVLSRAQSDADVKCTAIKNRLNGAGISFPPEIDLVVCGSLGRGEWTRSSDIDWFLLINGAVSNEHLQLAKVVELHLIEYRTIE